MSDRESYPVRIEGTLRGEPSRWLWLVKWLLAIPHYVVLAFLWLAFVVLTVVALFAILFTGRYPRGIFEFNVGVMRWTWRVAFYSYAALGTDRYPPFTLDDVPDYPARLEVDYPERLSRGLVLVKWWLLAIPQYIVVGILLGGGGAFGWRSHAWRWGLGPPGGLVGILVFFAGVVLLFTTRYPRALYDFVLGLDRWVARVAAYASLMTDRYPPFRLDQGGTDPGSPRSTEEVALGPSAEAPGAPPVARSRAARSVLFVVGSIAALVAFALLAGGCALVVVDQTQRDSDGYLMSPSADFSTASYAIVSKRAKLDVEGAQWAVDAFLGKVRIRSESDRAVFVGIGPAAAVDRYLGGVERAIVTDFERTRPEYTQRPGEAPRSPPGEQTFWVASASGSGTQTVDWKPEDGRWRAVVMNADASRGVAAEMSIGAELDSVLWIGIASLAVGAILAALAALAITAGARRR